MFDPLQTDRQRTTVALAQPVGRRSARVRVARCLSAGDRRLDILMSSCTRPATSFSDRAPMRWRTNASSIALSRVSSASALSLDIIGKIGFDQHEAFESADQERVKRPVAVLGTLPAVHSSRSQPLQKGAKLGRSQPHCPVPEAGGLLISAES